MQNAIKLSLKNSLFIILVTITLTACSYKSDTTTLLIKQSQKILFLKTPSIHLTDIALLKDYDSFIQVEVYSAGIPAFTLKAYANDFCINQQCMPNSYALGEVFGNKQIAIKELDIRAILRGEEILEGKNKQSYADGHFKQIITEPNAYEIIYEVTPSAISLRETYSKTIFMLTDMRE